MGISISSIGKVLSSLKKSDSKIVSTVSKKIQQSGTQKLYCQEYWRDALAEGLVKRNGTKESVSLHGYLNSINHHFINSPNPKAMDEISPFTKMTPRDMIWKTDFEFKGLKPIDNPMKAYRCVGEKPDFFSEYPLYLKRLSTKKGDIIDMKEYAYATSDINYAKGYLTNDKGIIYEIDIPEKARVSVKGYGVNNEIVFPRSSKFECIGTEQQGDTKIIKLKYILPDESFRAMG